MFVRQSLKENLEPEHVFEVSKATLAFYEKSFGHRYPFSKMDHIFAPDHKYGAMENIGCITYSDHVAQSKENSWPRKTWLCITV